MVVAESKKENYCSEISNYNTIIFSDVTKEQGGNEQYFGPFDLLSSGLASCLNVTTRVILQHKNIKYEKVIVKVDLDSSDENKTKFLYEINIIGEISEEVKQHIIRMLENSPVRKTLSKEIKFEIMKKL